MVEISKDSAIRIESSTNEWMDAVFLVRKEDEQKAKEVLQKAWNEFWETEDWCYGDFLESKLVEAGIAFDAFYTDTKG